MTETAGSKIKQKYVDLLHKFNFIRHVGSTNKIHLLQVRTQGHSQEGLDSLEKSKVIAAQ
jgi:hypothetical protein